MKKIYILNHKAVSWNEIYSANSKWVRKKIADRAHELVWAYCQKQGIEAVRDYPVEIKIIARFKDKRTRDVDNICSKVYIDGLKMASVLGEDDYRFVSKISKEIQVGQKENEVIIKIKEHY